MNIRASIVVVDFDGENLPCVRSVSAENLYRQPMAVSSIENSSIERLMRGPKPEL